MMLVAARRFSSPLKAYSRIRHWSSSAGGTLNQMNGFKVQTIEHKDARRMARLGDAPLTTHLFDDGLTLYDMLRRGRRMSSHGECLGYRVTKDDYTRPFKFMTYEEVISRSEALAAAIHGLGIPPGQNSRIGVFSINRPEWFLLEHACYTYNMVNVPVYATHGADECLHIVKQTEMPLILCDTEDKVEMLINNAAKVPELKIVVVCAPFDARLRDTAKKMGVKLISFAEFEQIGRELEEKPVATPPKPEDIATICYTSGTTGSPKGVQISHGNFAAVHAIFSNSSVAYDDSVRYLSYLPAAHMFERVGQSATIVVGGRIAFFSGNINDMLNDCQEFRPSWLITVPRVLNKVYNKVYDQVRFGLFRLFFFSFALEYKKFLLRRGDTRTDTWADRLFFHMVKDIFGGELKGIVCGSAPLNEEVLTFFRVALGCVLREGYGQTESTACGTITLEGDHTTGHVGVPMSSCEIKLLPVTVPEKFIDDSCGEICIRGPIVSKGYYNMPEATNEVFLPDGWLKTGDIGKFDDCGRLVLVDRIKNLVKLPNGEFLVPEKIEAVYAQSPLVEQIYVHGQSDHNDVVAIIVPDMKYLKKYTFEFIHITSPEILNDCEELCVNRRVRSAAARTLSNFARDKNLSSFEKVRRFFFTHEPFTVQNDLLTPTLKNKRPNIAKKYENEITWMYAKLASKEFYKTYF